MPPKVIRVSLDLSFTAIVLTRPDHLIHLQEPQHRCNRSVMRRIVPIPNVAAGQALEDVVFQLEEEGRHFESGKLERKGIVAVEVGVF